MFRLQIKTAETTIWCARAAFETQVFTEGMQMGDRHARGMPDLDACDA